MLYLKRCKRICLFFCLGSTMLFSAALGEKKFDVETGMVRFEISGDGHFTDDINISIKGEGLLRFKDWGVEALVEENYEERTVGAVKNINKIHICEKFENKQRFDVDFETEKILERPMPKGNFKDYYLKDMEKKGQETIAGYICDIWEGKGVRKCLYKGIPLLVENYLLGFYYQKKAVEVKLNITASPEKCALPDFPVEKFSFFKTSIKTKSIKPPKEFSQVIRSVSKEMYKHLEESQFTEDDLSEHQKRILIDKLGQNIFETQKKFLPELLESMKTARVCLQQAETTEEANVCIANVLALKKQISGDVDNKIDSWDEANRTKVLDTFDDNIIFLESKMKCIRAAKTISDLAVCVK